MKHSHGFGFPDNTRESHYFVDEHALCDPVLGFSHYFWIGESRPGYTFCPDCLARIADDARTMRDAESVTLKVDR